jgi:myo-inositol-1(or 4)-monophosphatase
VFFEYGLNSWDVAAGALLVQEAGGRACDFSGGADFLEKREMFASSDGVFEPALGIVKRSFL